MTRRGPLSGVNALMHHMADRLRHGPWGHLDLPLSHHADGFPDAVDEPLDRV